MLVTKEFATICSVNKITPRNLYPENIQELEEFFI
jgi:hypothetical protein